MTFYSNPQQAMREDFYNFCLPIWTDSQFPCTFYFYNNNVYIHTPNSVKYNRPDCCVFQAGLPITPPDFAQTMDFDGSMVINGQMADIYYFTDSPFWFGFFQKTVSYQGISYQPPALFAINAGTADAWSQQTFSNLVFGEPDHSLFVPPDTCNAAADCAIFDPEEAMKVFNRRFRR